MFGNSGTWVNNSSAGTKGTPMKMTGEGIEKNIQSVLLWQTFILLFILAVLIISMVRGRGSR